MSPYSFRVDIGDVEIGDDSSITNREICQEEGIRLVMCDCEHDRVPKHVRHILWCNGVLAP
jgi:hypothetical protein